MHDVRHNSQVDDTEELPSRLLGTILPAVIVVSFRFFKLTTASQCKNRIPL
jgi:hypothetical protein